jgi:hypothetical protein
MYTRELALQDALFCRLFRIKCESNCESMIPFLQPNQVHVDKLYIFLVEQNTQE